MKNNKKIRFAPITFCKKIVHLYRQPHVYLSQFCPFYTSYISGSPKSLSSVADQLVVPVPLFEECHFIIELSSHLGWQWEHGHVVSFLISQLNSTDLYVHLHQHHVLIAAALWGAVIPSDVAIPSLLLKDVFSFFVPFNFTCFLLLACPSLWRSGRF